jgi:hypothetical protein
MHALHLEAPADAGHHTCFTEWMCMTQLQLKCWRNMGATDMSLRLQWHLYGQAEHSDGFHISIDASATRCICILLSAGYNSFEPFDAVKDVVSTLPYELSQKAPNLPESSSGKTF